MRKLVIIILFFAATASASLFLNSFNSGQLSKDLKQRHDLDRTHMGSEQLENILIRPQGMAYKRPGTEFIFTESGEYVEETPDTYKYTYISENGSIWGVPFTEDANVVRISAGDAVNIGGGTVGINYDNAADDGTIRFASSDVINIKGTTNYDGNHTLTAGTTITQLQFSDAYNAESFDGTETVSKLIGSLTSSTGRMVQDSSGNLYYAHSWNAGNSTYITKIATDGTKTYNDLNPNPAWPIGGVSDFSVGLCISSDDAYLYTFIYKDAVTDYGYVSKFDLSNGTELWRSTAQSGVTSWPGYDMAVDSDGNAYGLFSNGASVVKFDADDGSATEIDLYYYNGNVGYGYVYEIEIDDDNAKCIVGGRQGALTGFGLGDHLYNMIIMDMDGSNQTAIQVGGYYLTGSSHRTPAIGSGCIQIHGDYIYVLVWVDGTTPTLYKYDFDGTEIDSADISGDTPYGVGLFFDIYGNLVVVNVDWVQATNDRYHFYDTDLDYLSSASQFNSQQLRTWNASAGGSWIQGNDCDFGALGSAGYWSRAPALKGSNAIRLIPFEYSTSDAYVLEFGHEYIGFMRTTQ